MAKFKWTVEFEVDEIWVADGFVLTDDRALEMLADDLKFAYTESELSAKVIEQPDMEDIAKVQGYKTAKQMLDDDPRLREELHL